MSNAELTPAPGEIRIAWSKIVPFLNLIAPVLIAFVVSSIVLLISGRNPLDFYWLLVREAFGGKSRLAATFASTTPLLFSGIATAVAFRAGYFNIGVEASFIAGAFTAAILGASLALWAPITLLLLALAAAVVGGVIAAGPAYLKAYRGVDEVVVTLMGNFVVVGVLAWLLNAFFLSTGTGNASSEVITSQATLKPLISGSQLTIAFPIALLLVIAVGWWLDRTVVGYSIRMTGSNTKFSAGVGIDPRRSLLLAGVISGAIGALGGWALTCGVLGRYVDGAGQNLGFTGIAVAIFGRGKPVGIIVAAVLLGALTAAGPTVQLFSDVPLDIIRVIQGTIMITAVVRLFARGRR